MFSGTNNILYTFPNILFVLFYFFFTFTSKLCKGIEFYLYTSLVGTQEVYLNEEMNEPKYRVMVWTEKP